MQAGGDVEGIHIGLQQLADFNALIQLQRALRLAVPAVDAQIDGEPGAAHLADPLQNHDGKTGAVFDAAAVLVGAVVVVGGEELAEQPAVGAVDHDHVEAGLLAPQGGGGVGVGDLEHHLLAHFPAHDLSRMTGLQPDGHGHLGGAVGALTVDKPGVANDAAVGQLVGRQSAILVDLLGAADQGGQALILVQEHLNGMILSGGMHDAVAHSDQRGSALGFSGIVGDIVLAQGPVRLNIILRGRRGDNTVSQGQRANFDGSEEVRELRMHENSSLS